VTEPLTSFDPSNQKRRSTRIVQAVPLSVTGVDALGQPFKERTTTVMVNCHGCKYQSKHYVPKNSIIKLEVPRAESGQPPRSTQGRVVWVQRPRTVRELFQIGLEFDTPGNVWGIAFPPDDWFPLPDEVATTPGQNYVAGPSPSIVHEVHPNAFEAILEATENPPAQEAALEPEEPAAKATPAQPAAKAPEAQPQAKAPQPPAPAPAAPASAKPTGGAKPPSPISAPPLQSKAPAAAPPAPAEAGKLHVVPPTAPPKAATPPAAAAPPAAPPAPSPQAEATLARHMARMVADAKDALDKSLRKDAQTAINEEMTVVRQHLDSQLHDAVEKAIKVSMDRVSESTVKKVVQQAADRTAAIVEEARKATETSADQLDAKVRNAVQEAVSSAAEQAAQQAAQQTAAMNLKDTIQQAVERAISEREAATPSLQILSSPEEAQRHLDQWKKDLEETAQDVRSASLQKSETDVADASRKWQEQFESALQGATEKLSEQFSEVSQAALAQAEQDIAARSSSLRASLDEVLAGAQASAASIAGNLADERARSQATKAELQEAARAALEQTRQKLDEVLAQQYQEIGRKADQVIADRTQQIDSVVARSAQQAVDRAASELDSRIAPKIDEARKAASELAATQQQTAELHASVQEQMRQASEQAAQMQQALQQQVHELSETAIQESLTRLKEETGKYPAEFEKTCRDALSKVEEDLEQKSTEMQHATYEALLKASEWYQKKAHTTMQSSLEKAVEQSTANLRDRAAEISSLVASELDHYRRTYLEHSQAQIEETAKEVVERERSKLGETAEIANAAFTDRVRRVTDESLRRFDDASREALEKARSDMEFSREDSLIAFQKTLDDRIQEGVDQAKTYLNSQLVPLVESWEENRISQQREWMQQLQKSTDESLEQYKTRLENASNSWLLASATTLGQHSQAVLDTIAKAAEKRLRDTCKDVLAGMGDTLKERLIGLSGDFASDEEEENGAPEPPKKK